MTWEDLEEMMDEERPKGEAESAGAALQRLFDKLYPDSKVEMVLIEAEEIHLEALSLGVPVMFLDDVKKLMAEGRYGLRLEGTE